MTPTRTLGAIALIVGAAACASNPPPKPRSAPAAAPPSPAPSVAPVATWAAPSPSDPVVWRFSTLTTGGPVPLSRDNGYYELTLEGDRAVVTKVGHGDTPLFGRDKVLTGSAAFVTEPAPQWPAASAATVSAVLEGDGVSQAMQFHFWWLEGELHGTWAVPDPSGERIGLTWGLLAGRRNAGEPLELRNGESAPCSVCTDAFFTCEGMGSEGCNSGAISLADCEERMDAARAEAKPVPRGCGDWMS